MSHGMMPHGMMSHGLSPLSLSALVTVVHSIIYDHDSITEEVLANKFVAEVGSTYLTASAG